MVRRKLEELEDYRGTFSGTFERLGTKRGWRGPERTVLLRKVKNDKGEIMCDHLWFNYTKGFKQISALKKGDTIQFDARVKPYIKGYQGQREDVYARRISIDYKLSHPTKINKLTKNITEK